MKFSISTVAAVSFALASSSSSGVSAGLVDLHQRDGELMTYYGTGSGGDSAPGVEQAGACGTSYVQKPSNYFVAVNSAKYSSSICGKCAQIVYNGKCTVAPIVDKLPSRSEGLDLSQTVFGNLVGGISNAEELGVIYASWSIVTCPSYIGIEGKSSSNDNVCSGYTYVTSGVSHGSSSSSSSSSNDDDSDSKKTTTKKAAAKTTTTKKAAAKTTTTKKAAVKTTTSSKKAAAKTTTSKATTKTVAYEEKKAAATTSSTKTSKAKATSTYSSKVTKPTTTSTKKSSQKPTTTSKSKAKATSTTKTTDKNVLSVTVTHDGNVHTKYITFNGAVSTSTGAIGRTYETWESTLLEEK